MNNILVVNVNWLGDAVFSIPVFKALKKTYPQARITCLCVPRVKEVLDYCPYVDKIIIYDERGKHRFLWRKYKLIRYLRKEKFDMAFLLRRSRTRALMLYLAGIPFYQIPLNIGDIHRCDYYLKVLEGYGIKVQDRLCELRLKEADMQDIDIKLSKAGLRSTEKYVVLNTGGNWDLKRWSEGSFVLLAKRLSQEFGLRIVLPGLDKDKGACERIAQAADAKVVVLAGEVTIGQSLALYNRAVAVISGDSGPLHLAHSVGADVVGIFGPTRPEITGPRGYGRVQVIFKDVGCNKAPCYHLSCTNNVCMQSVTVDDVLQAFKKITA